MERIRRIVCPSCHSRVMVGPTGEAYCEMCEHRYRVKMKSTEPRPRKKHGLWYFIVVLWILLVVILFWAWV